MTRNLTQKGAENKLLYKEESYQLLGACFDLYKELGCGHKETVYQRGLLQKLTERGLAAEREVQIPVKVSNVKVGSYVPDLVVDEKILVEIKAKKFLIQQDKRQFWQYLTATSFKLGFMVNFGKPGGVEYIRRIYDTARRTTSQNNAKSAAE